MNNNTKMRLIALAIAPLIALAIAPRSHQETLQASPVSNSSIAAHDDAVSHVVALAILKGLPACKTEDSANCYWNAEKRSSNGLGHSFMTQGIFITYDSDSSR